MSTTLDSYSPVEPDACPHGIEGVDEDSIRCWYCHNESETGSMAIDDPRREA